MCSADRRKYQRNKVEQVWVRVGKVSRHMILVPKLRKVLCTLMTVQMMIGDFKTLVEISETIVESTKAMMQPCNTDGVQPTASA